MKLEPGKFCPLIKEDCVGLKCSWFTLVRGQHPQTGQDVDEWNCAMTWLPVLLIENSQQQRQTGSNPQPQQISSNASVRSIGGGNGGGAIPLPRGGGLNGANIMHNMHNNYMMGGNLMMGNGSNSPMMSNLGNTMMGKNNNTTRGNNDHMGNSNIRRHDEERY